MPTTAKAVNEITMGTEMSAIAAAAEFDVPAILTHLLSATQGKYSQLERIIFSEGFVKDDDAYNAPCVHAQSLSQKKRYLLLRKQQQALSKELAKVSRVIITLLLSLWTINHSSATFVTFPIEEEWP